MVDAWLKHTLSLSFSLLKYLTDYSCHFLCCCNKKSGKKLLKEWFGFACSLKGQSIMVGRAQWQAHGATGHFASATPVHGMVLPQFRAGCPTIINLIQKPFPGRCTWNDNLKCHSSEGVFLGFFETGSLTGVEVAEQTRLSDQRAPEIHLSLHCQLWDYKCTPADLLSLYGGQVA